MIELIYNNIKKVAVNSEMQEENKTRIILFKILKGEQRFNISTFSQLEETGWNQFVLTQAQLFWKLLVSDKMNSYMQMFNNSCFFYIYICCFFSASLHVDRFPDFEIRVYLIREEVVFVHVKCCIEDFIHAFAFRPCHCWQSVSAQQR